MKVVIDTNIFVSSFFGGNPKKVIDHWKDGKIVLCLSGEILEEYVEVLSRLGLEGEKELDELLALFGKGLNIQFTRKTSRLSKFIECAVALEADYIISGDKALMNVGRYKKIKILSPQDFLKIVK